MTPDSADVDGSTTSVPAALDTDVELVGIVAVANNGVIGKDGEMPWHIPEDLAHFKEHTLGHPVVMGRVTYESILAGLGEPLPGRTTVVLTTQNLEVPENVLVANDLRAAIEIAERAARERHEVDRIFVAGGASVYTAFLPALDRLVVTEVDAEPAGDTYFPPIDPEVWNEVSRTTHDGFAFVEYERQRANGVE